MTTGKGIDIAFRVGPFPKLSETFVLDQIKGMLDRGHRVSVLADTPGDVVSGDPGLAWLKRLDRVDYVAGTGRCISQLRRLLPYRLQQRRRERLERDLCSRHDVVICNFGWFGESVIMNAGAGRHARVITIFHGADMSSTVLEAGSIPYPHLLAHGDVLAPISAFWRARLLAAGASDERIVIHRMGVDLNAFSFEPRPVDKSRPFRFISVCRFVEKKGMAYALRAVAALKSRSLGRKVQFDIVGGGPLETQLKALCSELGLDQDVHFLGERSHSEVANELRKADAFVLPSVVAENGDMEGIPVSLMEAMASGLPVVSTRHSGIPELIEDGVSGVLADERDVDGLADAMQRLVTDDAARAAYAVAAREVVAARFDSRKLNDQLSRYAIALASGADDVRELSPDVDQMS